MAIYTILFGLSIFMIALVMAIIQRMFRSWKEESKIESMIARAGVDRPGKELNIVPNFYESTSCTEAFKTVSIMISTEKCVFQCRRYKDDLRIYDMMDKSNESLKRDSENPDEREVPVSFYLQPYL